MKFKFNWLRQRPSNLPLWIGLAILTLVLLGWGITSWPGGISNRELAAAQASQSPGTLLTTPLFLPASGLHWLLNFGNMRPHFWLHLPSLLIGLLTAVVMAYILRRWYGPRTALFGCLIFVTSSWFLHTSRLATFDSLQLLAVPLLIASYLWLQSKPDSRLGWSGWLAVQIGLLYVPGMIWLILFSLFLQRSILSEVWQEVKSVPLRLSISLIVIVGILLPWIYAFARYYRFSLITQLLGLPSQWPGWQLLVHRLGQAVLMVGVRGHAPNDLWLNHQPVLNIFLLGLLLIGVYFYAKHWQATRTRLLVAYIVLATALYVAGGLVGYSLLVPLLYLIVAAGGAYYIHLWLTVFPRNPLARFVGIALVTVAIAISCVYSTRQYFVAWRYHPATKAAFSTQVIPRSRL